MAGMQLSLPVVHTREVLAKIYNPASIRQRLPTLLFRHQQLLALHAFRNDALSLGSGVKV